MYLGPLPAVNVTTPSEKTTMPLVVPGLTSNSKDKNEEWSHKLMGKKLGDATDEVVCLTLNSVELTIPNWSVDLCKERSP